MPSGITHDLVIVGGGPAGLATAIAARLRGLTVVVLDPATPPIDKACGEGIMPEGLAALEKLGVSLGGRGRNFRGIRFLENDVEATADFVGRQAVAIRRTDLHLALTRRAEELRATCRWGARVLGIDGATVRASEGEYRGRFLIGADGLNSSVRKSAGLNSSANIRHQRRRFGSRMHFAMEPWSDYVEVYWSDVGQMYATPVSDCEVGVALLSDSQIHFEEALSHFPKLAARLAGRAPSSALRGSLTYSRRFKRVVRGNVALVGDASGSVDAITGEGISTGFAQAIALADACSSDDMNVYAEAQQRILRRPSIMGRMLLLMADHPAIRNKALRVLSANPGTFRRLLGFHTAGFSPSVTLVASSWKP